MMLLQLLAMDPETAKNLAITLVMMTAVVGALLFPIARAYAKRLEGRGSAQLQDELADIGAQLDELHRGQERIAELEARLEFAERLLAQHRDPARLPAAGDRP